MTNVKVSRNLFKMQISTQTDNHKLRKILQPIKGIFWEKFV